MADGFLVPNWLVQRARTSPDHPAVICAGETLTFTQLARRAAMACGRLRRLGVQRGDRVALLLANRIELVELMHAVMQLGAVLVPLDRRLSTAEIGQRLRDADAAVLCYDRAARHTVESLASETPVRRVSVDGAALGSDPCLAAVTPLDDEPDESIDLQAIHTIVYTSGSSGRPKGVLLTCGNHFWSAAGSAFNLGILAGDRWLACLPFSHVGGLSILVRSVIYGTTAVIHERFEPEQVNDAIDADRVTIVSVVANMLQRMLDARGDRPYPPWLRCVLLGGGAAPRALLDACVRRGIPVVQTYGLTEAASQVTTLAPGDAVRKLGSAGKALMATEIRLFDGDGPAPAGAVGEILVRGPTVSPGYTRDEPGTVRSDGWLATGDLGRLDDEGFLYVVGRRDDMIVSGGENVHPAEIEAVLQEHPAVAEACVVGVPDDRWGETPAACVRLREGASATESDLETHARHSLAGFKVPRRIRFVADFPRTGAGKILRRHVREQMRSRSATSDPE